MVFKTSTENILYPVILTRTFIYENDGQLARIICDIAAELGEHHPVTVKATVELGIVHIKAIAAKPVKIFHT